MEDFFSFRKFITPAFMQVIFWILVAANTLSALLYMVGAGAMPGGGGGVVAGLFQLILGPIFIRVACELTIVVFRIHDCLQEIRNRNST
ncbi:MAG: DUF4282 domain-containing protein [Rhodospirillaceae bacterium]|nr:DUF4282 domain-containing protein [Rhodospirillaceae bacterium]